MTATSGGMRSNWGSIATDSVAITHNTDVRPGSTMEQREDFEASVAVPFA